jgi:hypothetical protein
LFDNCHNETTRRHIENAGRTDLPARVRYAAPPRRYAPVPVRYATSNLRYAADPSRDARRPSRYATDTSRYAAARSRYAVARLRYAAERVPIKFPHSRADLTGMLSNAPPMSNADRQRLFRERHPGYYARLHSRRRAAGRPAPVDLTAIAQAPAAEPEPLSPSASDLQIPEST